MQAIASMTVIPTGAMLGAGIRGVDLARDLDDELSGASRTPSVNLV